jgi:thymidylate synthase (FAD)
MSMQRQVLPGLFYEAPAATDRLPVTEETKEGFYKKLSDASAERKIDAFLLDEYFGISPLMARELVYRASGEVDTRVFEADEPLSERIWDEISEFAECVNENNFTYIKPESLKNFEANIEILGTIDGEQKKVEIPFSFDTLMDLINDWYYQALQSKVEPEDARMVLPNACTTSIIVTMNVRSLLNFFKHRDCKRAQWEIRELAQQMMEVCQVIAPRLFARAGASCRHGKCSEDSMSCGEPYN